MFSERSESMYILLAILIFGILIGIHEFGHFIAAKACGVRVNEFAIGMGPALLKRQKGETMYALRLLPIGGFCAMEGEDESSDDPRAFTSKPWWQRAVILIAGAFMNFLLGFLIIALLYSSAQAFYGRTVSALTENFRYGGEEGLMVGDEILSIDGHTIFYSNDFSTYMSRSSGGTVDMVIRRGGEKLLLDDYPLQMEDYVVDGETVLRYGVTFNTVPATFWNRLQYACCTAADYVRYVWMGLSDLVTGVVGIKDMSGPVGIVSAIGQVGQASASTAEALKNILFLASFIAVNLAVMNLLPIPALDGGRVFFLLITGVLEKILRRKIDPKYEGYIHAAGLMLLLGLMAVVMVNDIARIVNG